MHKLLRSLLCGLLLLGLLISFLLPAFAAEVEETQPPRELHLQTVEEFLKFTQDCRMDSYSLNLAVYLDAELDLTDTGFAGIPMFQGTFLGRGHTIRGLNLQEDGSQVGLFRYLTATALVKDLHAAGTVTPQGTQVSVGGLVGNNAGTLENCTFEGQVSGKASVGGLVGTNRVSGVISRCEMRGSVSAEHFIGGIAGENLGVIRDCASFAEVNTSSQENTLKVTSITLETLKGTESPNTVTDVGGIAGTSSGVIRDCKNHGDIGYLHMGYNIGGIAGSQSGYLVGCENHGDIFGRKEAGGIVGQFEPVSKIEYGIDTLQLLREQLQSASATLNRASYNAQSNLDGIYQNIEDMREHSANAQDAIAQILPGGEDFPADSDALHAAKNALNQSLYSMEVTMEDIGHRAGNTAGQLARDLKTLSGQMNAMGKTIQDANENLGITMTDVSDLDTPEALTGKVAQCQNFGPVSGDLNTGGIAGAIAFENKLDPEDDLQFSGERSLNVTGELRAVILECENKGTVSGKKSNIGGIVGQMVMGLVKGSANTGIVEAPKAQSLGGIAGSSQGRIRNCNVKCTLEGASQVGGIAGSGTVVTDCLSMVDILGGEEQLGAILGISQPPQEEEEQPIRNNFYLSLTQDPGAIDGISYDGQAQPLSLTRLLSLEGLPQAFQKATLTFRYEDGRETVVQIPIGSGISPQQVPALPEKDGFTGTWEGLSDIDHSRIYFDADFTPSYVPHTLTLRSTEERANGRPVLLAQGRFSQKPELNITPMDLPEISGKHLVEAWQLPEFPQELPTWLRLSAPQGTDPEQLQVLLLGADGTWREAEADVNASCLVVSYMAGDTAIALARRPSYRWIAHLSLGLAAAAAVVCLVCFRRKRRKQK